MSLTFAMQDKNINYKSNIISLQVRNKGLNGKKNCQEYTIEMSMCIPKCISSKTEMS